MTEKLNILIKIAAIALVLLPAVQITAQIQDGSSPYSFSHHLRNIKTSIKLESPNIAQFIEEDRYNDLHKDIPFRFGANINTDISLEDAKWLSVPDGKVWRVRIQSKNALTINLAFSKFKIPKGGKLWMYNTTKDHVIGAFTNENNKTNGKFSTVPINGDEIILEYFQPFYVAGIPEIEISQITHGYRTIKYQTKDFGDSGNCNRNVACEEGDIWREQVRSVAMIIVGSNAVCTGTMINNTCNDTTPYFLTANHCLMGDLSLWIIRYNWESPTCTNQTAPTTNESISGATLRGNLASSDFALLELSTTPPDSFNVYYAGWDRTTNISQRQVGIHHPNGDVKKISIDYDPPATTVYQTKNVWRVFNWEKGTTEGGSSGSALFNHQGLIIGQLYGGAASCSNNSHDNYGRFDLSWTGGGSNSNRLSNWLDGCSTNDTVLLGLDPVPAAVFTDLGIIEVDQPDDSVVICAANFSPSLILKNFGNTTIDSFYVYFQIDGILTDSVLWNDSLQSTSFAYFDLNNVTITQGTHSLAFYVNSNDDNISNDTIKSTISYTIPLAASLPFKEDFESGILPEVDWTINNPSGNTTWEFHSTGGFASSSKSIKIDHFQTNNSGSIDELISPNISFESISQVYLEFTVAYSQYSNTYHDSLIVLISTDCGLTWSRVYAKGSTLLSTTGVNLTTEFVPSVNQWRREIIDLATYAGNEHVQINFRTYSGYGNVMYLDDINVYETFDAEFNISDSLLCKEELITLNNLSSGGHLWEWSIDQGVISDSTDAEPTIDSLIDGNITVTLISSNGLFFDTISHSYSVQVFDSLLISGQMINVSNISATDGSIVLNIVGGVPDYNYTWNGGQSTASITGLMVGTYAVTVTDSIGCSNSESFYLDSLTIGIYRNDEHGLRFSPNPANQFIEITTPREIKIKIIDNIGRVITNRLVGRGKSTLNTSNFSPGVYSIVVLNATRTRRFPLIISH